MLFSTSVVPRGHIHPVHTRGSCQQPHTQVPQPAAHPKACQHCPALERPGNSPFAAIPGLCLSQPTCAPVTACPEPHVPRLVVIDGDAPESLQASPQGSQTPLRGSGFAHRVSFLTKSPPRCCSPKRCPDTSFQPIPHCLRPSFSLFPLSIIDSSTQASPRMKFHPLLCLPEFLKHL